MKNKQIDKSSWKVFNFKDVFTIIRGRRYKTDDHIVGKIAYISSAKFNNGITGYVAPPEYMTIHENILTLNNSGSIGYCFYHNYKFVCSDHCTVIDILDKNISLNIYIAMFLKPIIEKITIKYGFAREMSNERLEKENVLLPIDSKSNPDWKFMHTYIKNLSKTIMYNNQNFIHNTPTKKIIDVKEWKEFNLNDLFNISLGKPIHENQSEQGEIPYITRSALNNGLGGYMSAEKKYISLGNVITVGAEGLKAFYQPLDFLTGNKINIIRHDKLNRYNGLFISTVLNHIMNGRFNYGYAIVKSRLEELSISLPIDAQGNPDWDYMENYIKTLSYSSSL